jgi:hypothetical protein
MSRTWVALAALLRHVGRTDEAAELEARSKASLKLWTQKLPNYPLVLRQAFLPESKLNHVVQDDHRLRRPRDVTVSLPMDSELWKRVASRADNINPRLVAQSRHFK